RLAGASKPGLDRAALAAAVAGIEAAVVACLATGDHRVAALGHAHRGVVAGAVVAVLDRALLRAAVAVGRVAVVARLVARDDRIAARRRAHRGRAAARVTRLDRA